MRAPSTRARGRRAAAPPLTPAVLPHECGRYHNASGPPDAEVVVPSLATLLSLRGTQAAPVRDVTLRGLEFTASRISVAARTLAFPPAAH